MNARSANAGRMLLGGTRLPESGCYAYQETPGGPFYVVSLDDVAALGERLNCPEVWGADPYSGWCADTAATEMPSWWTPERRYVVAVVSPDGWSLHDAAASDEQIAEGEAPALASGPRDDDGGVPYEDGARYTANLLTGRVVEVTP